VRCCAQGGAGGKHRPLACPMIHRPAAVDLAVEYGPPIHRLAPGRLPAHDLSADDPHPEVAP